MLGTGITIDFTIQSGFDVLRTTRNVSHTAKPYPIAASMGMPATRGPMLCCMSKEAAM